MIFKSANDLNLQSGPSRYVSAAFLHPSSSGGDMKTRRDTENESGGTEPKLPETFSLT